MPPPQAGSSSSLPKIFFFFGGTLEILADTLAGSRTGTLVKHSGALWKFAAFVQARGLPSPFDSDEEHMCQYLCSLRENKAGATAGNAFLSAFRFAPSTFGLMVSLETLDSKRVRGVARDMYLRKAPRKPAPPLTVAAVKRLISLVLAHGVPKHIRLVAGHLLLGIFGVARWGDFRHMQHFSLDEYKSVVIDTAGSTDHKLARSAEAQVELLPYTSVSGFGLVKTRCQFSLSCANKKGFHSGLPAYDWEHGPPPKQPPGFAKCWQVTMNAVVRTPSRLPC